MRINDKGNTMPTQENILQYIRMHISRRGYSPSLQDISGNLGVSLSAVYYHVNELERKGHLTRERKQARSIRLTETPEEKADQFLEAWGQIANPEIFTREAVIAAFRKMDNYTA